MTGVTKEVAARREGREPKPNNHPEDPRDAEIAALKKALAPFAKAYELAIPWADDNTIVGVGISKGDLRRARSAHEGKT